MPDSYFLLHGIRLELTGSKAVSTSLANAALCNAADPGNRLRPLGVNVRMMKARKEQIMRDESGRKVETAVEARAAFLDRPVLVVLCVSLALGVIVLGALWLGFFTPGA
jgi:hypothetical protein